MIPENYDSTNIIQKIAVGKGMLDLFHLNGNCKLAGGQKHIDSILLYGEDMRGIIRFFTLN